MRRWGNSKELTRASYSLVKENPGMYRWTVRAAVHGALVGGIGVLVGVGLVVFGGLVGGDDNAGLGAVGIVALVLGALLVVASVIAGLTFANIQLAGLVSATDAVLHGRERDDAAAREAGRSRFGTFAAWSAISVAVNSLVGMIQGDGDSGIIVSLVRSLLAGLVAAVWMVATTLVLPVIVFENMGAVDAIKRSASVIRSTWGEAVLGSVRIGFRFFLIYTLPGLLLVVGGIVIGVAVGGAAMVAGLVLAAVGVVLIIVGAVKASTCRTVFGVALYRWATGEGALGPFSEDDLRGAVRVREGSMPVA
ncbi:MAG: hypothetical protein GY812_11365 [Actinomycetia bacterium]|nr:hypothetical protein [Actinomycetes bacterium]